MKRLIFDKYICPKDGHITIVNPAATSSLAYMLDCGDCCDCKERAKYYGKGNGKWIEKAYIESKNGCLVVCLLPSRTQTKWFHDYCLKGEIRFIKGKLKFKGTKHDAPFPSMIVIFK